MSFLLTSSLTSSSADHFLSTAIFLAFSKKTFSNFGQCTVNPPKTRLFGASVVDDSIVVVVSHFHDETEKMADFDNLDDLGLGAENELFDNIQDDDGGGGRFVFDYYHILINL